MKIRYLIRKEFVIVSPYAGVGSIEKQLLKDSFIVVLDQSEFLGILTPADIMKSPHRLVIDCLHNMPRADSEQRIESILELMIESQNLVLPVFKGEEFIGVVTQHDITDYLLQYRNELKRAVSERTSELAKANEQLKQEIEERKRAEEKIKSYQLVVESAQDAIFFKDLKSRYVIANPKTLEVFGLSKEKVIGKNDYEIMQNKEEAKKNIEDDQHIFKTGKPKKITKHMTGASGKEYRFQAIKVPQFDDKGNVIGLIGIARDITERKRAEEELQESEERFRDLVENSLVGISIIQNNQIVYRNPQYERLFGPLPESSKFGVLENVHPDDVERVREYYQAVVSGETGPLDMDFRLYHLSKKGVTDMKWVRCWTNLIRYQGKKAILVNMIDITRAKELEHLVMIRNKMTSLGYVAAGIAHEIRNPLSGMNLFLDGIRENFEDPESADDVKELINQAQSAGNKIESVVRRVLNFSRPNPPKFRLADINKPIREALNLSLVTLQKFDIDIESNLGGDVKKCHIDPQLIEQVVLNLLTNSAEAMQDIKGRKSIHVTSAMRTGYVRVKISDSGPGIPPEIKDKIFEPFYTTKSEGSGIGLSLSQKIIADHGGIVEASASASGGAEFTIKIPIEKRKIRR